MSNRMEVRGKWFVKRGQRILLRAVTFGPFPGGMLVGAALREELRRVAAVGFHAVRLYEMPSREFLQVAAECGLDVFGGLRWEHIANFRAQPGRFSRAKVALLEGLRECAVFENFAGVFVANEIPADLVRWMGPVWVRERLEELIELGKDVAPDVLFAYANYPSTEFLEPENADFSAMNVYLEDQENLRLYALRLQHVAGDRPLFLSEFGVDTLRNGEDRQAELVVAAWRVVREVAAAGLCVYSWSDRWWNAGMDVLDWNFGLTTRDGREKRGLVALREEFLHEVEEGDAGEMISVIVCTRNGRARMGACLQGIFAQRDGNFEVIVVDDGSTDGTGDWVREKFPLLRCVTLPPSGLSVARNVGASLARGGIFAYTDDDCVPDEFWLRGLRQGFSDSSAGAVGGPNLPPCPATWQAAVVQALPGAATHVMLDDEEAEHLPGCNLAVRREAFACVGGFREKFHTAGDDVDFCWRLREAGIRLRFVAGAFVWHWRRADCVGFLRQQWGYGDAERLLREDHPARFNENGNAIWQGVVYQGSPRRVEHGSVIYHGPMGQAGYQGTLARVMPLRAIRAPWNRGLVRWVHRGLMALQPWLRAWARGGKFRWRMGCFASRGGDVARDVMEWELPSTRAISREEVLAQLLGWGWNVCDDEEHWDLQRGATRLLVAIVPADAWQGSVVWVRMNRDDAVLDLLTLFVISPDFGCDSNRQR